MLLIYNYMIYASFSTVVDERLKKFCQVKYDGDRSI